MTRAMPRHTPPSPHPLSIPAQATKGEGARRPSSATQLSISIHIALVAAPPLSTPSSVLACCHSVPSPAQHSPQLQGSSPPLAHLPSSVSPPISLHIPIPSHPFPSANTLSSPSTQLVVGTPEPTHQNQNHSKRSTHVIKLFSPRLKMYSNFNEVSTTASRTISYPPLQSSKLL